jgi:hydroxyacylglutathione hydrolase
LAATVKMMYSRRMAIGIIQIKLLVNYTYFVFDADSRESVVIDPAWNLHALAGLMERESLSLKAVFLTHHHFDHTNCADALAEKHDIPVYMAKAEIDYYHFRCRNLQPIEGDRSFAIGRIALSPCLTPGHTQGSMCYRIGRYLFTGDTLFAEGCGLCTCEGGDPVAMFASLAKLKILADDNVLVYPGHSYGLGPGQTFGSLLKSNVYLQISDCEKFVRFRMRKNQRGLFQFK